MTDFEKALGNIKIVSDAEIEASSAADRAKRAENNRREFAAAIGRRYATVTLESFSTEVEGIKDPNATAAAKLAKQAAVESIRSVCSKISEVVKNGHGLILHGPGGTGKDHLLAVAGFAAIDAGFSVVWNNGIDLYGEMRDRIGDGRPEADFVRRYSSPDVLILSDPVPPAGAVTPHQSAILLRILDRRYRDVKPTWVSVNVETGADMRERIGNQAAERLKHNAEAIHCNWPSHRKPLQAQKSPGGQP